MFEIKLDFLLDVLKKKETLLKTVRNITENQNMILVSNDNSAESNAFFREMNREKQHLIDEILDADNVFQTSFKEIDSDFEQIAVLHREKVVEMQSQIEILLEMDVAIRGVEQTNKGIMDERRKMVANKSTPKAGKNYILNQYKNNTKKPDAE